MIEIDTRLYVGNELDYENSVVRQKGWAVVHACKDPYHRRLLGYTGRSAPKDHSEYLLARRGDRLFLNLVDAPNPDYFPLKVISTAVDFVSQQLSSGSNVLVHCNKGESRGPGIGFLYLISRTSRISSPETEIALQEFATIYPPFNPSGGMLGFIRRHFSSFHQLKPSNG